MFIYVFIQNVKHLLTVGGPVLRYHHTSTLQAVNYILETCRDIFLSTGQDSFVSTTLGTQSVCVFVFSKCSLCCVFTPLASPKSCILFFYKQLKQCVYLHELFKCDETLGFNCHCNLQIPFCLFVFYDWVNKD